MSPEITITPEKRAERMSKALVRAQAFVKMQGHENVMCVTAGELSLFQASLKCAQTEIEHWGNLYLMMTKDEQRLTKMVQILSEWCAQFESGHTLEEVGLALSNGMACPEPWQYVGEAARRASMAESEENEDGPRG